jgi:hypothetical protein
MMMRAVLRRVTTKVSSAHALRTSPALYSTLEGTQESTQAKETAKGAFHSDALSKVEESIAPEIKENPVEFSVAAGAGVVGIGLMLWWMSTYLLPQDDIQNEMARQGGPGEEGAKKIVEAQRFDVDTKDGGKKKI